MDGDMQLSLVNAIERITAEFGELNSNLQGIRASLKSISDDFSDVCAVVPRTEGDRAINIMQK